MTRAIGSGTHHLLRASSTPQNLHPRRIRQRPPAGIQRGEANLIPDPPPPHVKHRHGRHVVKHGAPQTRKPEVQRRLFAVNGVGPRRRAVGPVGAQLPELGARGEQLLEGEVGAALFVVLARGVQLERPEGKPAGWRAGCRAAEEGPVPLALLQREGLEARDVERVVELLRAERREVHIRKRQPLQPRKHCVLRPNLHTQYQRREVTRRIEVIRCRRIATDRGTKVVQLKVLEAGRRGSQGARREAELRKVDARPGEGVQVREGG